MEDVLIEAAEQILRDEGPAAITVRKVATCAGVAPMGVYNHFDGKQGLIEAVFVRGFDQLRQTVASASGGDARARLRDAGCKYREFALQHPEHYRLMFVRMHEVEPGEQALQHAFAAFDQLVQMVGAARQWGPLGQGSDVQVAQQLWSALHGAVSLELLGIGFDDDPASSFDRTLDAMLAGLTAQASA